MAFSQLKFIELDVGVATGSLRMFSYRDRDVNTLAEIAADGFFDAMKDIMRVDDLIFVKATDGESLLVVTTKETTSAPYIITDVWTPLRNAVVASGQLTTVGGSATEVFTVNGITTSNFVVVQLVDDGTNNVSILSANITAANQLTVVFSGDPSSDTIFNYIVTVSG